jgi:hypothetical protein
MNQFPKTVICAQNEVVDRNNLLKYKNLSPRVHIIKHLHLQTHGIMFTSFQPGCIYFLLPKQSKQENLTTKVCETHTNLEPYDDNNHNNEADDMLWTKCGNVQ